MTPSVEPSEALRRGIDAVRREEYLLGLTLLSDAYASREKQPADGLSYYGLCVALVQKKMKPAVDLCRKAIELQFYHPEHYGNLARVYMAADNRKKAIAAVDEGLRVLPDDETLVELRRELGRRRKPVIPFLPRDNAINVALGRARHAKEVAEREKKAKATDQER